MRCRRGSTLRFALPNWLFLHFALVSQCQAQIAVLAVLFSPKPATAVKTTYRQLLAVTMQAGIRLYLRAERHHPQAVGAAVLRLSVRHWMTCVVARVSSIP